MIQTGIDLLHTFIPRLAGKRVGLITGPTGLNADFRSTIDLLHDAGCLKALFSPEHGVRGDLAAGAAVDTYADPQTGLPVYSLYRKDSKRLTPEMLAAVDALVFDIQDVGARYYTYLYTLLYALEDAAKAGLPFFVLDRPTPLGGEKVEGNVLKEGYKSFVGGYPLAMRYGLTIGEFAEMVNAELGLHAELTVIHMKGWRRDMLFPGWQRPWLPPSLGIPSFETAFMYPGMCLFEGTGLSEGRGTASPFLMIGAPYIKGDALAKAINAKKLPGLQFLPAFFTPSFSKHQGTPCQGVRVLVTDYRSAQPVEVAVHLLCLLQNMYPKDFCFLPPHRAGGRAFIELLGGGEVFLQSACATEILSGFCAESEAFALHKSAYHLY